MNYQKYIAAGNMTKNPVFRETKGGEVAEFGLAINKKVKKGNTGKPEDWVSETFFINCVAWNWLAKKVQKYGGKGVAVFIEGELRLNTWTTQEGVRRQVVKVNVKFFDLLDRNQKYKQIQKRNKAAGSNTGFKRKSDIDNIPADNDLVETHADIEPAYEEEDVLAEHFKI